LALVPAHLRPEMSAEEQARLGDYAVAMRYPGDYEPVSFAEAERAVQIARRVRAQVRHRLPRAGMTSPKSLFVTHNLDGRHRRTETSFGDEARVLPKMLDTTQ